VASEALRIALIEPVGGYGGMDHYDYGLAKGLADHGAQVDYHTSENTEKREHHGVHTIFSFGKVWSKKSPMSKLLNFLNGYIQSFGSARTKHCEVVHLQFFSFDLLNAIVVFILNRFSFKTKVLTIHDISSFKSGDKSFFRKYILNSFDKLIVHNQFSFDELINVTTNTNISIIPHGNYSHSVSSIPSNPNQSDELNLLFFGQVKKVKGLDILLEALHYVVQKTDQVNLVIAGKVWHDDLEYYKSLIKSYQLEKRVSCHFTYIPNSEVASFFEKADVVVLPYRQIYQSGVLLLAMSYGRAVLASDLPPFKEIIKDGVNGLLFENSNITDLSNKVLKLVQNKAQLNELVQNASTTLESQFNWTLIGHQTLNLYTCK
jgi:D-inositol-3-phosphate glycosyltransferase